MSALDETKNEKGKDSNREYNIVVYGATGFAGKYICKVIAKRLKSMKARPRWAIAGRNESKLEGLRRELVTDCDESERKSMESLPILIADVKDTQGLSKVIEGTDLVINAVGPYRFFGEPVLKLCAEYGTHYVDVCGEPEFMEKCALKYFERAQETGAIIVSACGFDSIPSDIGQSFVHQWYESKGYLCTAVECYVTQDIADGYTVNSTTYKAAIHGFANVDKVRKIRKQLKDVTWRHERKNMNRAGPKQKIHKELWFWSKMMSKYAILFPFADSAVVSSSQGVTSALLHSQGVTDKVFPQFACYLTFGSGWSLAQTLATGVVMKLFGAYGWTRSWLESYPYWFSFGQFSDEGPTQEQIDKSTFTSDFFGEGYSRNVLEEYKSEVPNTVKPDVKVHATVHGPDAGYDGTGIMAVESAFCLLEEAHLIKEGNVKKGRPAVIGGVFTPSTVFQNTTLVDRLNAAGIQFTLAVTSAPPQREEREEDENGFVRVTGELN